MDSIWAARRSATDGKVSGLAAGVARAWNVDPVLVRVGFVVLALSGGIGIVLYLAGWLMIPLEGRTTSYLGEAIPRTQTWSRGVKLGIVAVACLIGAAALSWLMPFSTTAAIIVAAVWYFGYYRNRPRPEKRSASPDPAATEPTTTSTDETAAPQPVEASTPQQEPTQFIEFTEQTPFTEAAQAWQQRISDHLAAIRADRQESPASPVATSEPRSSDDPRRDAYFSHPDPVGLYTPQPSAAPVAPVIDPQIARRKRQGRRLTLVSLVVLGLAMTGLGIASAAGLAVATGTYLAVALLILGLTLLVGTFVGRPPGVTFMAVIVALSMLATLVAGPYAERMSVRSVSYTAATLPTSDQVDVGQLTVDLRQLKLDESRAYSASVDAGRLEVFLPKGVTMDVEGSVDQGMLQLPNQSVQTGSDLTFRWPKPNGAKAPVLTVHLLVDNGQLEVHR